MTGNPGRWWLWLGSGTRKPCEVCGRRWPVWRYTNGTDSVSLCWQHRHVAPTKDHP